MPDLDALRARRDELVALRAQHGGLGPRHRRELRAISREIGAWAQRCDPAPETCILCDEAAPDVRRSGGEPGPVCDACWLGGKPSGVPAMERIGECGGK